jgi:hypothetical protein
LHFRYADVVGFELEQTSRGFRPHGLQLEKVFFNLLFYRLFDVDVWLNASIYLGCLGLTWRAKTKTILAGSEKSIVIAELVCGAELVLLSRRV